MAKYKIAPFTPPSFCPNSLFPRPEIANGHIYGEIEVGDYKAPTYAQF